MMLKKDHEFTKYEIARIIGARALQIAMDAPLLLKLDDSDLKLLGYDALKIAQKEFEEGVLPISINRPTPKKRKEKLTAVKIEKVSDEREGEIDSQYVSFGKATKLLGWKPKTNLEEGLRKTLHWYEKYLNV